MKSLSLDCACGMVGCTTRVEIEDDSEKTSNIIVRIINDKHEYSSFISLGREELVQLIQKVRTKYKGLV